MVTNNNTYVAPDKPVLYRSIFNSISKLSAKPIIGSKENPKLSILEKKLHIHKIRTLKDPTIFMETLLSPDLQIQQLALESTQLLTKALETLSISHTIEYYFPKFSLHLKEKFLNKISRLNSLSENKADELFKILYRKYNTTYIYSIFNLCSFGKLTENIDLLFKFPVYKHLVLQKIYKKKPQFFTHLVRFLEQQNLASENTIKSILPQKINKDTFKANTSILFKSFNNKPLISLCKHDQFSELAVKELFKKHKETLQRRIKHFLYFPFKYYFKHSFPEEIIYLVIDYQFTMNKAKGSVTSFSDIISYADVYKEQKLECFSRYFKARGSSMGFEKLSSYEIIELFNYQNKNLFFEYLELDLIEEDIKTITPPEEFIRNTLSKSTASMFLDNDILRKTLIISCLLNSPDPIENFISIIYNNFMEEKENIVLSFISEAISNFQQTKKPNDYTRNWRRNRNKNSSPRKEVYEQTIKDNTMKMLDEIIKMFYFKNQYSKKNQSNHWENFYLIQKLVFRFYCFCKKNKLSNSFYLNKITPKNIYTITMYTPEGDYEEEKDELYRIVFEKKLLDFQKLLKDKPNSISDYKVAELLELIHDIIEINKISDTYKIEIPQDLVELVKSKAAIQTKHMGFQSKLKEVSNYFGFERFTDERIMDFTKNLKIYINSLEFYRKYMAEILNSKFDFIVHFKELLVNNFPILPKIIKKLVFENEDHPTVKEVYNESMFLIEQYDENNIRDSPCSISKLSSAIDFLSYTNEFPQVIEKIFSRKSNSNDDVNDKKVSKWSEITSIKKSLLKSSRNYHNPEQIVFIIKQNYPKELETESLNTIKNLMERLKPNNFEMLVKQVLLEYKDNLIFIRPFQKHNPEAAFHTLQQLTKSSLTNQQKVNVILYMSCYLKTNEKFEIFDLMAEMIGNLDYNLFKLYSAIRRIKNFPESLKKKQLNLMISKVLDNTDNIITSCCYNLLKENYEYLENEQKISFLKQEILSEDTIYTSSNPIDKYNKPVMLSARLKSLKEVDLMKEFISDIIKTIGNIYSENSMKFIYMNKLKSKIKEIIKYINGKLFLKEREGIEVSDKVELIEFTINEWSKQKSPFINAGDLIFELRLYKIMLLNYNENKIGTLISTLEYMHTSYTKIVRQKSFGSLAKEVFDRFHAKNTNIRNKIFEYIEQRLDNKNNINSGFLRLVLELYYCYNLEILDVKKESINTKLFDKALEMAISLNANNLTNIRIENYIGI